MSRKLDQLGRNLASSMDKVVTQADNLVRENERLRAENAALRAALGEGASETIGTLQREVDRLRAALAEGGGK